MSSTTDIRIVDITDESSFRLVPPCADPGFDHRSCDYWEDEVRGSKAARASWWERRPSAPPPKPKPSSDNPFAPAPAAGPGFNPFDPSASDTSAAGFNPFAPTAERGAGPTSADGPSKLRLLDRGSAIFGSYAKVLLLHEEPAVYAQFGPLSAYPRALHIRELYPRLPSSPLPAVITCIATTAEARGRGLARALIEDVIKDLAERGFAAVETYPDRTLEADQASTATPGFWRACGFDLLEEDDRFPVMRRDLG